MRNKKFDYYLWAAVPILTTLNQACIKMLAADMQHIEFGWEWLNLVAHNPWALGILACEILGFIAWLTLLANHGISKAVPITAIAYFLILLMSWTIFREPVIPLQIVGSILILGGVWLISTATNGEKTKEKTL